MCLSYIRQCIQLYSFVFHFHLLFKLLHKNKILISFVSLITISKINSQLLEAKLLRQVHLGVKLLCLKNIIHGRYSVNVYLKLNRSDDIDFQCDFHYLFYDCAYVEKYGIDIFFPFLFPYIWQVLGELKQVSLFTIFPFSVDCFSVLL